MGLWELPSFSRHHRVPAENRNEDEKPGAFAPQRQESLACSSSPLLILVLRLISASFQCLRVHILHLAPAHWEWIDDTLHAIILLHVECASCQYAPRVKEV